MAVKYDKNKDYQADIKWKTPTPAVGHRSVYFSIAYTWTARA